MSGLLGTPVPVATFLLLGTDLGVSAAGVFCRFVPDHTPGAGAAKMSFTLFAWDDRGGLLVRAPTHAALRRPIFDGLLSSAYRSYKV